MALSRPGGGIHPRVFRLALALAALVFGCTRRPDPQHVIRGPTMGTTFTVKIVERGGVRVNGEETQAAIVNLLATLNGQFSTYLPDSEIARFNRYEKTDWFPISKEFALVLEQSLALCRESAGAFDITVGPVVNLWGFGPEKRTAQPPEEKELTACLAAVGYEKLAVRLSPPAVRKTLPQVSCDCSAIAKGFAVDQVAEALTARGCTDYMVEIGGEVTARGKNARGQSWRIGIERPDTTKVEKVIRVRNCAMATSGDYRNYFEQDGTRYSHTIDPRTGKPITHRLASVSVLHPSCMMADGLATAIMALGPQEGYALAERLDLSVLLLVREGDGFAVKKRALPPVFSADLK